MYKIMARYYAAPDQFGESYVITSDNNHFDTKLEIGQEVDLMLVPEELDEALAALTCADCGSDDIDDCHGIANKWCKRCGFTWREE